MIETKKLFEPPFETAPKRDLSTYISADRMFRDGICLAEFTKACEDSLKLKCAAAEEMFSSIKAFLDHFYNNENPTATVEQIAKMSAALQKAQGDL